MTLRDSALTYTRQNNPRFLSELKDFLRIPSISSLPDHQPQMWRAAEWVADQLRALRAERVELFPTRGHPIVYGELPTPAPNAPLILVYGHYDVQPVSQPGWLSDPFIPEERDDNLYARGATDMKGQIMAVLKAVESLQQAGPLPAHLKFLIEGEEEVTSENLDEFIATHKELLACDFCLNPDAGMIDADTPAITYALRGAVGFDVRVVGPAKDVHSGLFGGVVHNPAQVLCELIAGMHDAEGRVTLPGFYDAVRPLEADERAALAQLPTTPEWFMKQSGARQLWHGEKGYTPVERSGARPTLEVNAFHVGPAEGIAMIVPHEARAKLSMRLVSDQSPEAVHQQLLRYMEARTPPSVQWEVKYLSGAPACYARRDSVGARAMSAAFEAVWGKPPLFKRSGGSIPVVGQLQTALGIESVLTGFSLPEDGLHSPNEKLHLPTWRRGIEALIHFFGNVVM
jgi:acetylornithine deacetylase/succinyl-diaminopimelate desuccinylase-like protein